jgi:hypothetical protein
VRWIIGSESDIAGNNKQLQARSDYIRLVTNADVSAWDYLYVNNQRLTKFLCCSTNDVLDGTLITAHIRDVYSLCSLPEVCNSMFVVANTCIWESLSHKDLLYRLMSINQGIELYFSKQELSVDNSYILRQSTTISNIGQFGYQTSLSERVLFRHRRKGILEAIRIAFNRVSPILLLSDVV